VHEVDAKVKSVVKSACLTQRIYFWEINMIKRLFAVILVASLSAPSVFADEIDDLLDNIAKENSDKARIESLYSNSTKVGTISVRNKRTLRLSLGSNDVNSDRAQNLVWYDVNVVDNDADRDEHGNRQQVVAVSIRNVSKYSADGPWINISQFWVRGATDRNGASEAVRLKTLETKSVSLDSVPNRGMFKSLLAKIKSRLQTIANFYGTYLLKHWETRVVYLDEPLYVDHVQVKAVATDNTPNSPGKIEVRFLYK